MFFAFMLCKLLVALSTSITFCYRLCQTSINEALLQLINTVHMIIHTFAAA